MQFFSVVLLLVYLRLCVSFVIHFAIKTSLQVGFFNHYEPVYKDHLQIHW